MVPNWKRQKWPILSHLPHCSYSTWRSLKLVALRLPVQGRGVGELRPWNAMRPGGSLLTVVLGSFFVRVGDFYLQFDVCLHLTPFLLRMGRCIWALKNRLQRALEGQKIGKMAPKPYFWASFPIFWLFSGEGFGSPKPIFFLFFPISGRRPETYSVPGQRNRNLSGHTFAHEESAFGSCLWLTGVALGKAIVAANHSLSIYWSAERG